LLLPSLEVATTIPTRLTLSKMDPKCSASPCPANWMYYKDNCYGYFRQKKDWNEAEVKCQSWNAHLVSILSKKEACRVRKFLTRFQPDGNIWIGLHNPSKVGLYETPPDSQAAYILLYVIRRDLQGTSNRIPFCNALLFYCMTQQTR
uniref:C-type lectin domain-containing protein n=1 Tax=Anolis carolinensis TaxID=28377 RepID=L7MZN6_ANOCA